MNKIIEKKLYELVKDTGEYKREIKLTGFLNMKGKNYDGELMVIGRATNGWGDGWLTKDVADEAKINGIVDQIIKDSGPNDDENPIQWVSCCWGHKIKKYNNYNTKRSAFWRVIRKTLVGLNITDDKNPDWPLKLCWSNLYKIAPYDGGNPTSSLIKLQCDSCKKLLKTEIMDAKPKKILMLTGLDWAQPFWDYLEIKKNDISGKNEYVEAKGTLSYSEQGYCVVVVAKHPQGKRESEYVEEVINAFQN